MRKRFSTLRARFALWAAGLLLAVLLAFGTFVYVSLARGLLASIDDSLRLSAAQIIATADIDGDRIRFADDEFEDVEGISIKKRGLTVRILDPAGRVLMDFGPYHSLPVNPESLTAALQGRDTFKTHDENDSRMRIYSAPIIDDDQIVGVVQSIQSLEILQTMLEQLLAALLLGGAVLIFVAAGGGYLLATRALAPIDAITRTARRMSAADLAARLNLPNTDDEVGRLAATFDGMLARLETSFQRERRFTADASHELRTPLAAMQAILSVVRAERRSPAEYEQALADLAEESERLRGLVENLLFLARGDAASTFAREPVDLSTLLHDICDSLRPLAEEKGLALTCTVPAGLALTGDSDQLIRLFVNLLENAVKYTQHGYITVEASNADGYVWTTVADTGIGVPDEHLPQIFERFYRVESARTTPGMGLGLAIALDIARRHGGTIDAHSLVGRGARFTVRLPVAG